MKAIGTWTTGSKRGYCPAADHGKEGAMQPITAEMRQKEKFVNFARALKLYDTATHYTVTAYQGTDKG